MKGIVLAGGTGSRLHPITTTVSKQLLPVYDKPLIYYPISVLMLAGITDILVITTSESRPAFERLLGDGAFLGLRISYREQERPRGLADGLLIGEEHIGDDSVALVLGDNIFYGPRFAPLLRREVDLLDGCSLFGYPVADPTRFGVAETDDRGHLVSLEEKPTRPRSNRAVTGLYMYENGVVDVARDVRPSARGEIEITDVNRHYLEQGRARLIDLGRGFAWFDTGTGDALVEAAQFVHTIGSLQGVRIACLEEVALHMGYISASECFKLGELMAASDYGRYVMDIADSAEPALL